jgi:hypothetical protein
VISYKKNKAKKNSIQLKLLSLRRNLTFEKKPWEITYPENHALSKAAHVNRGIQEWLEENPFGVQESALALDPESNYILHPA